MSQEVSPPQRNRDSIFRESQEVIQENYRAGFSFGNNNAYTRTLVLVYGSNALGSCE